MTPLLARPKASRRASMPPPRMASRSRSKATLDPASTHPKLARLLDLTSGLRLTLDYTHYAYAGIADAEVEPLIPHARHFQARGPVPGKLQAKFADNTIDYRRILQRLQETGYAGFFSIEYVWTDWQQLNETENICETILMRDFVRATLAGEPYSPLAARAEMLP